MTIKQALEFGLFTILGSAIDGEDCEKNDNGDVIFFIDEEISKKYFSKILQDYESYLYYIRITPRREVSIEASNEEDLFVLADDKRIVRSLDNNLERIETLTRMIACLQEMVTNAKTCDD